MFDFISQLPLDIIKKPKITKKTTKNIIAAELDCCVELNQSTECSFY